MRKRRYRQIGGSNVRIDRRFAALHPGKRRSKRGKIYYEYRRNRSDRDRRRRL